MTKKIITGISGNDGISEDKEKIKESKGKKMVKATNRRQIAGLIVTALTMTAVFWARHPEEVYFLEDLVFSLQKKEVSATLVTAQFPASGGEVVATSKEEKKEDIPDPIVAGLKETISTDPEYRMFGDGSTTVLIQKRDNPPEWIRITRKASLPEQATIQHTMNGGGKYTILFHYGGKDGSKNFVFVTSKENATKEGVEVILSKEEVKISVFEGPIRALKKAAPAPKS